MVFTAIETFGLCKRVQKSEKSETGFAEEIWRSCEIASFWVPAQATPGSCKTEKEREREGTLVSPCGSLPWTPFTFPCYEMKSLHHNLARTNRSPARPQLKTHAAQINSRTSQLLRLLPRPLCCTCSTSAISNCLIGAAIYAFCRASALVILLFALHLTHGQSNRCCDIGSVFKSFYELLEDNLQT